MERMGTSYCCLRLEFDSAAAEECGGSTAFYQACASAVNIFSAVYKGIVYHSMVYYIILYYITSYFLILYHNYRTAIV